MNAASIAETRGRQVWDSRGHPTIEVEVELSGGAIGRAIAPAGASTGSGEARELRDGGTEFGGRGVSQAVAAVGEEIDPALRGLDASDQEALDHILVELDGTPDKSRLGGNTLIATSMAIAHAVAALRGLPLWRTLGGTSSSCLPLPEIQILGGGVHAAGSLDIQDFMVIAVGASDYAQALEWSARVYHAAGVLLADQSRLQGVADEGGYWANLQSNRQALETLLLAIERAGLEPGSEMGISLDIAASSFGREGRYHLLREDRHLDSDGLCELLLEWTEDFPIVAIEDPLAEDDMDGMIRFARAAGDQLLVVGDDFLVTSARRVARAAKSGACNALLLKPNQAGTLTEARAALEASLQAGWQAIVSARSGETEDVTIVHLAVGWTVPLLKVGSFSRSERMAKWNEGLRIAESLGGRGTLPPRSTFPWG